MGLGPTLPASDLRFEHVLAPAVAAGRLEKREVRRLLLGRPCQIYRSGDYLSASAIAPATADVWVDSCIDGDGLLLEEVLFSRGAAIARRVAVQVNETVKIPEEVFALGEASIPASKGGGSMRRLKDGSTPPGPFFVADAIPEGFVLRGRYSVIPPQPENFGEDPEREDFRRAMVSDVYERGNDVLVLEQGATLRGAPPFEADPTNPTVDLGPFGMGEIRFSAVGNQVRAARAAGRFVQATGTLAPDDLIAVLKSLREVPGGSLDFADGS